jgi:hypothetical protein
MRRAALAMITGEIAPSMAVISESAAPGAVVDIVRGPVGGAGTVAGAFRSAMREVELAFAARPFRSLPITIPQPGPIS